MAQKHNEQYVNAPMTRLGTIGWPDQDRRVIRSSAFVASKWTAENPILQLGEVGYETDTNKLKVGDGVTKWNSLPYAGDGAGSSLPDQTGHAGEFLTTDGTDASWGTINALENTATGTSAIAIIGQASSVGSIGIGLQSSATGNAAVAIGWGATTGAYGALALGGSAKANATGSIQLNGGAGGNVAVNNDANTFKVANANGNYEIMSADGTIPTDRFTTTPSADGTYVPTLTISSGVATRTWGSGGGGGLQNTATGTESLGILNDQSGNYNTVVGVKDTSFGSSVNGATTLGYKAVVSSSEGAVAIGRQAKVGANNTSDGGIAIGYLASTTYGGTASTNAICIGKSSHATGSRSLAIGSQAVSGAAGAIQLGGTSTSSATTNSDANTFKVANANGNFELMDANGNLPADRLASTTGLADGNYRLRLVMASGVPTLEWVAE